MDYSCVYIAVYVCYTTSSIITVTGSHTLKCIWRLSVIMVALASFLHHHHQDTGSGILDYAVEMMYSTSTAVALKSRCDKSDNLTINLAELYDLFVGRESNMTYLEQKLLSNSVHVLGISGPPGFGKSTLAIHLGWKMMENCYKVGYIDLEGQREVLPYVVKDFNEKRLTQWIPPMELTSEEGQPLFDVQPLKWFVGKAVLIIDNCNRALSDKNYRKLFYDFLVAMIQSNKEGRIVFTSDEELPLSGRYYRPLNFALGNLSVEASVEFLRSKSPEISVHDAEAIATAVENCPIALSLIGELLKKDKATNFMKKLIDRKDVLKLLNETEHKYLNFISVMDVAFGYLARREQVSGMYFSFFPRYFPIEVAAELMMLSDEEYNSHIGIGDREGAMNSIKELNRRSLLDRASFGEVDRYKMHRLIKFYFMDRGEIHDDKIQENFNTSFRIHFSKLGVRLQPIDDIRAKVETELLSDPDRDNFYYLVEMVLLRFGSHIYSEDELIHLALAFYKGFVNFDHNLFKKLLKLYTYPHPQLAVLPKNMSEADILSVLSGFDNFFVNVLCKVTTHDVCINVYLDILVKLYIADKCDETFEDTIENSCHMVNCDYINDYTDILDKLEAFHKCSDARFCNLLSSVRYMCSTFEMLKFPLETVLVIFFFVLCTFSVITIITCFRVRRLSIFICKQFGLLITIYIACVLPTYTLSLRKYVGLYFDAPLEVHARNVICSLAMFLFCVVVLFRLVIGFVNHTRFELYSLVI